jgi:hypothetical protein
VSISTLFKLYSIFKPFEEHTIVLYNYLPPALILANNTPPQTSKEENKLVTGEMIMKDTLYTSGELRSEHEQNCQLTDLCSE